MHCKQESPQFSGTKRSLMNKFDINASPNTTQPRKKPRSRHTSENTTPILMPIKSESLYSKSTNNKRNAKSLLHSLKSNSTSIESSEDIDLNIKKPSYNLRRTPQRQRSKDKDATLEWQKV